MLDVNNGSVGSLRPKRVNDSFLTVLAFALLGLIFLALTLFMNSSVRHVTVETKDRTISYLTFAPTVSAVLKEAGVKGTFGLTSNPANLKAGGTVSYNTVSQELDTTVRDGMKITVYRDKIIKIVEDEKIMSPVKKEWDIFLLPSEEKIIKPGRHGILRNTYLYSYRDGALVFRKRIDSRVVSPPVTRLVSTGSYQTASRDININRRKAGRFVATAYTYTGYNTATGAKTRRGIVAVDPRVIPLGTHMYVAGYGYAVAADTGGVIKGQRIDVFLESEVEATKWGRRTVDVYILEGNS